MKQIIKRIVFTGGPGGGKTLGVNPIKRKAKKLGWKVFICRETATDLLNAGFEISDKGICVKTFQEQIVLDQIHKEDMIYNIAKQHKYPKILIIHDRAIMDGMAYLSRKDFIDILKKHKLTITSIRKRYDAIFHLVSAAIGAEASYGSKTNKIRSEDLPKAQIVDEKTKKAWKPHRHIRVIDNSTAFKAKLKRLSDEVITYLKSIPT
ncbi:MAG: hypothetical protein ACD_80C00013G0011 [uncultured bacterium (gcode 4)]|uniref:NadR/Ttd14 AAA domain-containing protein n=1 Tax=uncultured bacterium (gcode 4) TaxID=1234023 RepID=K1XK43_9BACT|nr:MAG: hypothetical protein ACD_80C00013G0011 [uncultured bacterium (gcode 4)]HBB04867.1 hypothetical protein [Candidatus Gracilibacteria bacterium]